MKCQFAGRVIGHELFKPDPDRPQDEWIAIKIEVLRCGERGTKPTKASLGLPAEEAQRDFPLKRGLLITIEEGQLEIFEPAEPRRKRRSEPEQRPLDLGGHAREGAQGCHDAEVTPFPVRGRHRKTD